MDSICTKHLTSGPNAHSYDSISVTSAQQSELNILEGDFKQWYQGLFLQPNIAVENAWKASQLEYQFSCSAPSQGSEIVYKAEEYYHGHLDWYNIDKETQGSLANPSGTAPSQSRREFHSIFYPCPHFF